MKITDWPNKSNENNKDHAKFYMTAVL